jgi:hypothetical protein
MLCCNERGINCLTSHNRKQRDRNFCCDCGTKISKENAYPRTGTLNGLHARCHRCYIKKQRKWFQRTHVKLPFRPSVLINRSTRYSKRIYFTSEQERQDYIRQRRLLVKFGCNQDTRSSKVGGTEDWGTGTNLTCDDKKPNGNVCGGLLRYSDKGELVCELCGLCSDSMVLSTERLDKFDGTSSNLYDNYYRYSDTSGDEDSRILDVFYSRAYSKSKH